MGRPKATLAVPGGGTFLTRLVGTLLEAGVEDVVVVVGHEGEAVMKSADAHGLTARFVYNADYEHGQLSSLVAGLALIDRPGVAAVLVTPVDAPLVAASTVRAVVERYRRTRAPIVRPVRGAQHGHPVLIDRGLFEAIRRADPATGAKPIVRAHASAAGDVVVDDDEAFADVDTPAEYERMMNPVVKGQRQ
jgi:CTP:molybdopterin cytidylyltransferase MocA